MRFGREVAAARRVSGVFTAMVVDADVDGPEAWLATAYVPGPSLSEVIADQGPLPAGSLLTLAAGLAESLGAVLTFAATGEGPFGTGTTAALLFRVVHGSPSLDQVPAEVRPLIERCLAKDPGQRLTADGVLAEIGALQPTANWLPESIIREFARDPATGPAPATAGMAFGSSRQVNLQR